MLRKIIQLRYPDGNLSFTFPETADEEKNKWSLNLLANYGNVVSLGVYGLPGTKFKINQLNAMNPETLILSGSGMFSINIEERPITELSIHKDSVELLDAGEGTHYIVLDLIYEGGIE